MGFFDSIADGISSAWNGITGAGTSSFKPTPYQYDKEAFKDPYMQQNQSNFANAIASAKAKQAPTVQGAQINTAPQDQFRGAQSGLVQTLQDQIAGRAPSAAEMQMRQGAEQNLSNSAALAASSRGRNVALAQRQAQLAQANTTQATNRDMAIQRANETNNAVNNLANVSNSARSADINLATNQASNNQQANLANQSANLQQQQIANQQMQYYQTLGYNEQQAALAAQRDLQAMQGNDQLQRDAISKGIAISNANQRAQNIGGLVNMGAQGAAMLAMSDENMKTDLVAQTPSTPTSSQPGMTLKERLKAIAEKKPVDSDPQIKNGGGVYGGMMNSISKGISQGPQFNQAMSSMFGSGGGAVEASPEIAAALSDEDEKKNKSGDSKELYNFLDAVKAYKYKYKDPSMPGAGSGDHYSVMAQDLEKTPVGESMVMDTPNGKMVDYGKGFGAMLAAQAQMHDRLKRLESKRG